MAEGEYIKFRDELQKGEKPAETEESDEEAIGRIEGKFNILNEMAEAVATRKVRAMIVSGPPGIGKSYGVETTLERFSTFDDIAGNKRKFEVVKGAMSVRWGSTRNYMNTRMVAMLCALMTVTRSCTMTWP